MAVVTGAGRGFGREIARRLAGRGYSVLATDIDAEAALRTADEVGGFSAALDVGIRTRTAGSRGLRPSAGRSRSGSTTPGCCAP
jgi:NAD(P)-dependent dehydrogenase (short-subunit alcohol dehydrogenase family)